jgi:ribosomal RNA-processing protein 17
MFARPRPKKSPLPPPSKKRKATHSIEEISFDNDARADYLTGFHKRKLQRVKNAQEEAAKRARQEKIDTRKQVRGCTECVLLVIGNNRYSTIYWTRLSKVEQIREGRRREVEEHVQNVSAILKEAARAGHIDVLESASEHDEEEWEGVADPPPALEQVDHQEEYIDEDKYTTVTVESVNVSRDGLVKPEDSDEDDEEAACQKSEAANAPKTELARPKKKKPKFRYETKAERLLGSRKQKIKKLKARA